MRQNPHVRICGGLGSATALVYPTAFRSDDQLFLARQIESLPPKPPRVVTRATKDSNLQTLLENARELGIDDLLTEAAAFVQNSIPGGYCWPGKLAYAPTTCRRPRMTTRLHPGPMWRSRSRRMSPAA